MPSWMADHTGQTEAWEATARKLIIVAGWQSGKTDFLVRWCLRQMKRRGPGDALILAPSHPLLIVALQPRLVWLVESLGLGSHVKGDNYLYVPGEALKRLGWEGARGDLRLWFRHTQDAKAVEATTALWVAGDECGQMSDEVGEAIDGRTSATGGEVCLISRPYFDNWFRKAAESPDQETKVVNFASWDNPGWRADLDPETRKAEVKRLELSMPAWKFKMKYGGRFTKPAGSIIDNWEDRYEVEPFVVPGNWKRFTFHDFGQVHAFVVSAAEHPTEKDSEGYPVLVCYREHFPNQARATWQLVRDIKRADERDFAMWSHATGGKAPVWRPRGIGGASSEDDWRKDYAQSGLNVEQPGTSDVGTQIDRLYACVERGGLWITKDCRHLLTMLGAWSWEIDDAGEKIPGKIKDDAKFHGPAALRYGVSQLRPNHKEAPEPEPKPPLGSYSYHGLTLEKEAGWKR